MKISILGCGWLGFPLGKHLVNRGHQGKGSTTSEHKLPLLSSAGIEPFLLKFMPLPEGNLSDLLDTDTLIICLPPRASRYGDDFHVQQIQGIIETFGDTILQSNSSDMNAGRVLNSASVGVGDDILPDSNNLPQSIIYISSTSVYPETNTEVNENAQTLENSALVKVENLLKNTQKSCTILRCGGLMGYDRIPAKYVSGKRVKNGHIPVNFVHQDDVVAIITMMVEQQIFGETFNVVAPQHPLREDIYRKTCEDLGYEMPIFEEGEDIPFKIISPKKLIEQTGYKFLFPDPMGFTYQR